MFVPSDLTDRLREFNRKERFYVVGTALGNPDFRLSADFRSRLGEAFGVRVPPDAFVAMDYHLDWLYAAVFLATEGRGREAPFKLPPQIKATQEDIDLLVAFGNAPDCHILLIEAKGVGGFTNKQMDSKRRRLQSIFGKGGTKHAGVRPHFGIMSPTEPTGLLLTGWSGWLRPSGKLPWIELKLPMGLRAVMRCDLNGRSERDGGYWTLVESRRQD